MIRIIQVCLAVLSVVIGCRILISGIVIVRNTGVTLSGLFYLVAGATTLITGNWWPIVVGYMLNRLIPKIFHVPDASLMMPFLSESDKVQMRLIERTEKYGEKGWYLKRIRKFGWLFLASMVAMGLARFKTYSMEAGNVLEQSRDIAGPSVLIASAIFLALFIYDYSKTAWLSNGLSLGMVQLMLQVRKQRDKVIKISFRVVVLTLLSLASVLFIVSAFNPSNRFFAISLVLISLSIVIRDIQPPVILFLSKSNTNEFLLFARVANNFGGLRSISLLYEDHGYLFKDLSPVEEEIISIGTYVDVFRSAQENDWESAVQGLMKVSPIIVLDTRAMSPALLTEVKWILNNGHLYKTLFIVDDKYQHPLLDEAIPDFGTYAKLEDNLVTEKHLLSKLAQMIGSCRRNLRLAKELEHHVVLLSPISQRHRHQFWSIVQPAKVRLSCSAVPVVW